MGSLCMETFDIYYFGTTESESFFLQAIERGTSVWLDGVNGFFDQYFDGRLDEIIRFLAVRDQDTLRDALAQHTLGQLPLIEAYIGVNNFSIRAEVEIRQVHDFQTWAEACSLSPIPDLSQLALGYPLPVDVVANLIQEARQRGNASWLRPRPRWQPGQPFRVWQAAQPPIHLNGLFAFSHQHVVRCVIVNDYVTPSVVFDITDSDRA
jgi:hypothetical protein